MPLRTRILLWRQPALRSRARAFTLVEIVVALAVITVGLVGLFSALSTQDQARTGVRETQKLTALATSISERIYTMDWKAVGTSANGAEWTQPRPFDPAAPLAGGLTEAELIAAGLLAQPTGIRDLRFYIEFYRTETTPAGQRGLLDNEPGAYANAIPRGYPDEAASRSGLTARLAALRGEMLGSNPTSALGEADTLAIRTLLLWADDGTVSYFGGTPTPDGRYRFLQSILVKGVN